jgi:hypothetical protein
MAALDAWEATGELRYFEVAEGLAERLLSRFYDEMGDAFFDTEQSPSSEDRIGALSARRKPLQDAPTPAGNPVAVSLLLRLHALTDREVYRERAEDTLEAFGGIVEHFGLHAASYGQALRRLISPPVQVCILGNDALAEELAATATARFSITKSIIRLRPEQMGQLPPALAATLPHLPGIGEGSVAVVCKGFACLPPVRDPERLIEVLGAES